MVRLIAHSSQLLRLALMLPLLAGLAGCVTAEPPPAPSAAQPQPLEAAPPSPGPTLAFEPLVGLPADRAPALATALGNASASAALPVVARDVDGDQYRVKGYLTVAREEKTTIVSFVWDIFDADGMRVHRITGSETVPAALPDLWSGVPDDTLERIAQRTVEALAAWLSNGAPVDTALAGESAGPLAAVARSGPVATPVLVVPPLLRATETALVADPMRQRASPPPAAERARFTVFLQPVAIAASDGPVALATALAGILAEIGGKAVASPSEADFVISAEGTVAPPERGMQTVALIWTVATATGDTLGTVRQVSRIAAGSLDTGWGEAAQRAAASAAPGVISLMIGTQ